MSKSCNLEVFEAKYDNVDLSFGTEPQEWQVVDMCIVSVKEHTNLKRLDEKQIYSLTFSIQNWFFTFCSDSGKLRN